MRQGGHVTLVGFVATEPRIHHFSDGTAVTNLRIGSTARQVDRQTGEWRDGETSFYSVKCWRKLAQNVATCLRKGQPIIVAGKLYTRSFEDRGGRQRSEIEVQADTIGFDLARGEAHFSWSRRSTADPALARGEAIRAGLDVEDGAGVRGGQATGAGAADGDEMFDEQEIADLEQELDASAAEPAVG
jgi:single-strand DNA-binding protein